MEDARIRVAASRGEDPAQWPHLWGIRGPGIPGRDEWRGDHALRRSHSIRTKAGLISRAGR